MVFWLGDLNYRLSDIENDRAKLMIKNRQLTDLMNYDQVMCVCVCVCVCFIFELHENKH